MTGAREIVETARAQRGVCLGDIVFVRLRDATVRHTKLERLATSNNFPVEHLPEALNQEQAFQTAMRRLSAKGYLVRPVVKDEKAIVWAAVKEEVDKDAQELAYQQETRLAYLRGEERTHYEHPQHKIATEAEQAYQELIGAVTTDRIRAMVTTVCSQVGSGIPIGTEWFVPSASAELLRQMKGVIESLGNSELWLLPIHDSQDACSALNSAVRATIEEQIRELQEEIREFTSDTRQSTIETRIDRFAELRSKAELYAGILQVTHEDLTDTIGRMERKLSGLLGIGGGDEQD